MNLRSRIRMALPKFLPTAAAWGVVVTAAVACAASTSQQAPEKMHPTAVPEGTSFEERIIWTSKTEGKARFIPQRLWDTTPLEKLPIPADQMEWLKYRLGREELPPSKTFELVLRRLPELERQTWRAKQLARNSPPIRSCEVPQAHFREARKRPEGQPRPLHHLVESYDLTFVGEVIAVVNGASPSGGPLEAVYIRVGEILQDRHRQLRPGVIGAQLRSMGSVVVQGVELCKEKPSDLEDSRVGDTVLIGGSIEGEEPGWLSAGFELLVVENVIQPAASMNLSDELPKTLARLRQEYHGDPLAAAGRSTRQRPTWLRRSDSASPTWVMPRSPSPSRLLGFRHLSFVE